MRKLSECCSIEYKEQFRVLKLGTVSKIMVASKITFELRHLSLINPLTITKVSCIHIVHTAFKILLAMKVIPNFQALLMKIYNILQWHVFGCVAG